MNANLTIALSIMGMGMAGIFTAMLIIMAVTLILGRKDTAAIKKETKKEPQENIS